MPHDSVCHLVYTDSVKDSFITTVLQGWLVDMVNKFGMLGGFQKLLARFQRNLSVSLIAALIRYE